MYRNFICYRGSSSAGLQVANELYAELFAERSNIGDTYFSPINDSQINRNFLTDPARYLCQAENFIMLLTKDFFGGFLNSDGTINRSSVTLIEIDEALKNDNIKIIPVIFPDFSWEENKRLLQFIWGQRDTERLIGAMPIPYVYQYKSEVYRLVKKEIANVKSQKKIVIFDFDGTLTKPRVGYNTWETLWIELGYPVSYCEEYHKQYSNGEITHDEWCEITEEYFKKANMNRQHLIMAAKDTDVLPDTKEVLTHLKANGVLLYILSGSIKQFIEIVLGKEIVQCFTEIKANRFVFDSQGNLDVIVGTPYDFEGKARFISKIIEDKHISANDILYVGNSFNDEFVYKSGVDTLCINPAQTDFYNSKVWHNYLRNVNSLKDILPFIEK